MQSPESWWETLLSWHQLGAHSTTAVPEQRRVQTWQSDVCLFKQILFQIGLKRFITGTDSIWPLHWRVKDFLEGWGLVTACYSYVERAVYRYILKPSDLPKACQDSPDEYQTCLMFSTTSDVAQPPIETCGARRWSAIWSEPMKNDLKCKIQMSNAKILTSKWPKL